MKYNFIFLILILVFNSGASQNENIPIPAKNGFDAYAGANYPYEPIYNQEQLLEILRKDRRKDQQLKFYKTELTKFHSTVGANSVEEAEKYINTLKRDIRIRGQEIYKLQEDTKRLQKKLHKANNAIVKNENRIAKLKDEINKNNSEATGLKDQAIKLMSYSKSLEDKVVGYEARITEYGQRIDEVEYMLYKKNREIKFSQLLLTEHGTDVYIQLNPLLNSFGNKNRYSLKKSTNIKLRKFKKKRNRKFEVTIFYYALPEELEQNPNIKAKFILLPPDSRAYSIKNIHDEFELYELTLDETGKEKEYEQIMIKSLNLFDSYSNDTNGKLFHISQEISIPDFKYLTKGTYYIAIAVNDRILVRRKFTLY